MEHTKHGGLGAGRGEEERNSLGMEIRESRDCLGPESEPRRFLDFYILESWGVETEILTLSSLKK